MRNLTELLLTIRTEAGDNKTTMAKKMGMSLSNLTHVEGGTKIFGLKSLKRLIHAYHLSKDFTEELKQAWIMRKPHLTIELWSMPEDKREYVIQLVNKIDKIDKEKLKELLT